MKDTKIREALGIKIRHIRERKELTIEELAKKCGVTATNLSRIEDGRYSAPIELVQTIAEALGATLDIVE